MEVTAGPRTPPRLGLDSTLPLLREGYPFILNRVRRRGVPVFRTRLLLRPAICLSGAEAAELFYSHAAFSRVGAAPGRIQKTLFGQGGVQGLDGEEHRCRKHMFMALMGSERLDDLEARFTAEWRRAQEDWAARGRVVLFPAAERILCRAVCGWAGVPLPEEEVEQRTEQLSAMIEGSGAVGPRHWRGRRARSRAERWARELVERARAGELDPPERSALAVVALHTDPEEQRLDPDVAAVELLNVLRPTVAVARYIAFLAHALHRYPEHAAELEDADDAARERFVHEVRRLYPFFPFAAAVLREPVTWNGYHLPEGPRVLLDLYGTNRDGSVWEDPDRFDPGRFRDRQISPFTLIPQGGGDHSTDHRCPGEWITIRLMKQSLRLLTAEMGYRLAPDQDLAIDLTRIPAIPESRVVLEDVHYRGGEHA